jgi:signal transduction histidine kinase
MRNLRLWPRSLSGQLLLAIALALFVAQGINAFLIYRGARDQAIGRIAAAATVRLMSVDPPRSLMRPGPFGEQFRGLGPRERSRVAQIMSESPFAALPNNRMLGLEERIGELLNEYGVERRDLHAGVLLAATRPVQIGPFRDDGSRRWRIIVAMQRPDGNWIITGVRHQPPDAGMLAWIVFQTLVLYLVLMVPVYFVVKRVSDPLGALTQNVEAFSVTQRAQPMKEHGPQDITRLVRAYNRMAERISSLLEEKDVMLGAIGHDLKTPLAALRVRIESIDDDQLRQRMARGVEDITAMLDDILTLARVGRANGEMEVTNISALAETLVEEQNDLGRDVEMETANKITMPVYVIWLRRAMQNLIDNAVRYAGNARVSMRTEGQEAVITVRDTGPGISEESIERMFQPFARLEASRSTSTGGTGLGLTLARAIIEEHGGSLTLANARNPDGSVAGLIATIRLPIKPRV